MIVWLTVTYQCVLGAHAVQLHFFPLSLTLSLCFALPFLSYSLLVLTSLGMCVYYNNITMTNPFDCVIDASDHIFHLNTYALHMYSYRVYMLLRLHILVALHANKRKLSFKFLPF